MKKILFIALIIITGSNSLLLSWDSTAAKFYPLAIGNKWSFTKRIYAPPLNCTFPTSSYVFIISITGDTLVSGHKYFRFNDGSLVRIDSNSMNVYKRTGATECMTDSLLGKKDDRYQSCMFNLIIADTSQIFFAGENRRTLGMFIPEYERRLMSGIGLFREGGCANMSGVIDVLNGCIINGIQYGEMLTYSISGTVRFQDNNQLVTSGKVKALKIDRQTRQIITLDSAIIQPNGTYTLPAVPKDSTDIMAFQDDEESAAFVPTYYQSTINWQNSNTLFPASNLTNINIDVFRNNIMSGSKHISGVIYSSTFLDASGPLQDAFVYIRSAGIYRAYSRTASNGYYSLDDLEDGTYHISIDRLGYNSVSQVIKINNSSQENINFTLSYYVTGLVSNTNIIPESFELRQNYPNPFNPVTKIKFDIPNNSKSQYSNVRLVIYDMLGRQLSVLVEGDLQPGEYEIDFDGRDLASGVYIYSLEAKEFSAVKKMILLK